MRFMNKATELQICPGGNGGTRGDREMTGSDLADSVLYDLVLCLAWCC